MAKDQAKTFMVEGARLVFRNFSGKESAFNAAGERNFGVVLTQEAADKMSEDGWNIKYFNVHEEGDIAEPWIPVKISFDNYPPRVVLMTSKTRTNLDESRIEVLDWSNIANADIICRGYEWGPINGKSGLKAYVKSLFVTLEEDYLEQKYAINEVVE